MLRMSCYNYAITNPASSIPIALHTAEFYSLLTLTLHSLSELSLSPFSLWLCLTFRALVLSLRSCFPKTLISTLHCPSALSACFLSWLSPVLVSSLSIWLWALYLCAQWRPSPKYSAARYLWPTWLVFLHLSRRVYKTDCIRILGS